MSKYTTEVRFICENSASLSESVGGNSVNEIIDKAIPKVFNFDFPIFDESYRGVLCKKILKHYYTREIGLETVGLWKLKLDTKLNEIMPYYNQLYKSELIEFNPMYTVDVTTERSDKRDTESKGNQNRTDNETANATTNETKNSVSSYITGSDDKYSDTPQGSLGGVDDDTYLTNARIISGNGSGENADTVVGANSATQERKSESADTKNVLDVGEYLERVTGKNNGESNSDMLLKFRETFLNIDMMIIGELGELFMGLW